MKYGAIMIDPPWPFKTYSKDKALPCRTEDQPYPAMALHEIAGLPMPDLAAKDCAVFLWRNASLPDMPAILARLWGFRLVTDDVFVWDKGGIGMGHWTRKQSETVSLMCRGRPKRLSGGVRQIIQAPRREHSRKPDEIYNRIESLVGGPYLEMFARQQWPGWDSWGNETDKFKPQVEKA
jgi:N6-adenosine-specific RNA methylase IME4